MHAERCDLRAHGWCWAGGRRRSGDVWCSDFADGELYEESDAAEWRAAVLERAATRPCRRINDPYARQPSMHIARDRLWPVQGWAGLKFGRCQSTPPSGGA